MAQIGPPAQWAFDKQPTQLVKYCFTNKYSRKGPYKIKLLGTFFKNDFINMLDSRA